MVLPAATMLFMAAIYCIFTVDSPSDAGNDGKFEIEAVSPTSPDADTPATTPPDTPGTFGTAASNYRTWILFLVYSTCFGVELTVFRFGAGYFTHAFGVLRIVVVADIKIRTRVAIGGYPSYLISCLSYR